MQKKTFLIILFGTLHHDDPKLKSYLSQVLIFNFQLTRSWVSQGLESAPCALVDRSNQILEVWKINSLDVFCVRVDIYHQIFVMYSESGRVRVVRKWE